MPGLGWVPRNFIACMALQRPNGFKLSLFFFPESRKVPDARGGVALLKLTVLGRSKGTAADKKLAEYLASAFETSDAGKIAHALGVAARAKGMSHVAQEAGVAREQLYRSLSKNGNPTLKTVLAILGALAVPADDQTDKYSKAAKRGQR
jgi:probable addiction module antidote protein